MASKLSKDAYPANHSGNDFECFGPIAEKDGEFYTCKLADLGCFNQALVDSNKFYHACICRSKINNQWYVYFEWGRTGRKGTFQFVNCSSEFEAQEEFSKQLRSKNDKRGEWVTKPGLGRILQAKQGKDCYLVRPLATRDTSSPGLPGARSVTSGVKVVKKTTSSSVKQSKSSSYDPQTIQLMRDLNVGTVQYAKANIQGGTIPTQQSIEEGRTVLIEAQKRIVTIGNDLQTQIHDQELRQLTYHLYSRVPKTKPVGSKEETWILSKDNIFAWQQDLDCFESALKIASVEIEEDETTDPFGGMKIEMEWLSRQSPLGEFIYNWAPKATKNRHGGVGTMSIRNLWRVTGIERFPKFVVKLNDIHLLKIKINERPDHQPSLRPDLKPDEYQKYKDVNVGLCFHGTRSCNVRGILADGFRLPHELKRTSVTITGSMFGSTCIYTADDWKKSAGYTSMSGSYWSGGNGQIANRGAFMLICDAIYGRTHVANGPYGYTQPPVGCHSVFGKAGVSGVQNNEWMVYNVHQINIRYLMEFK
jgi:predicted DNA-binding WGR domain protein